MPAATLQGGKRDRQGEECWNPYVLNDFLIAPKTQDSKAPGSRGPGARGGKYAKRRHNVAMDACRGKPASKYGENVLSYWGMNGEFGCAFEKYTQQKAENICLGWCDRMSYFCKLWVEAGADDEFEFLPQHKDLYEEPEWFKAAIELWPPNHAAFERLADLRACTPMGKSLMSEGYVE